jgi:HK97 family phage major capsid protein
MVFPALAEAEKRLKAKQDELAKIFNEAGPEIDFSKVKSVKGDSREIAAHVRSLNDNMTDMGKEVTDLKAVEKAAEASRRVAGAREEGDGAGLDKTPFGRPSKSFGQLFTDSTAYKNRTNGVGPEVKLDIELKALFATTAGFAPETIRNGRVVESAQRPVQVMTADIIPQTTTSQSAVTYMEETTFTNTAAETAEGGTYPEAALALTEQSSVVRKVAVFLPVTDEQLEDEPQARGYIDNRLPFMVRQRLDSQLLVGNGTAPNLRGILNVVGIQTQAKGADPTPDAVYKAMTKVRVTGQAMPDAVVFHPNDWQDVRLLRTADGIYIWGNPSDAGPERIWGLQVVQAQAETENTALVGDFANFSELAVRRGIDVQVSNSHSTYFIEGKQALRADIRVALVVYRPAAFCTVTGI